MERQKLFKIKLGGHAMKALKNVLIVVVVLVLVSVVVTGINIFQKGGKYDGRSMEKILGVAPEKATIDDIKKLSKAEVFQLFYAASEPSFQELKGEYIAATIDVGIMATSAGYYTHHFFGPGRWRARSSTPSKKTRATGITFSKTPKARSTGPVKWIPRSGRQRRTASPPLKLITAPTIPVR